MFKFFRSLSSKKNEGDGSDILDLPLQKEIQAEGKPAFPFLATMQYVNGLPVPDWEKFYEWYDEIEDTEISQET